VTRKIERRQDMKGMGSLSFERMNRGEEKSRNTEVLKLKETNGTKPMSINELQLKYLSR